MFTNKAHRLEQRIQDLKLQRSALLLDTPAQPALALAAQLTVLDRKLGVQEQALAQLAAAQAA
jgi:hypothetical protein